MNKIEAKDKARAMAEIGTEYAVIEAAKAEVHALEVQAAAKIKNVVSSFGPGPHKMAVPTNDGGSRDFIVNFRRSGDTFSVAATAAEDVT